MHLCILLYQCTLLSSCRLTLPKIYCAMSTRTQEETESWDSSAFPAWGAQTAVSWSPPAHLSPEFKRYSRDYFFFFDCYMNIINGCRWRGILISWLLTAWNSTVGLGISSFLELHFGLWSKSFCYLQSASLPHSFLCWTLEPRCSDVMETLPPIFPAFLTLSESAV